MAGATPIMLLPTMQDSDQERDYLTQKLVGALLKLDSHNHSGGANGSLINTSGIAANAVWQYLGGYRATINWSIPASGTWYETPSQLTTTTSGGMCRIDACGSFTIPNTGQGCYVGFGVDGTLMYDSLFVCSAGANGQVFGYSYTVFTQPAASSHRFATFMYGTPGAGFNNWTQLLYVTEQKR